MLSFFLAPRPTFPLAQLAASRHPKGPSPRKRALSSTIRKKSSRSVAKQSITLSATAGHRKL